MIQKAQRTAGDATGGMSEIVDTLVPQIVKAKTVELVKVILQERVSERTVEQIVLVPAEIPRARVQQRTVEFGTNEVPEKSTALSQTKADSDELKPDCTNSGSSHADRAAAP